MRLEPELWLALDEICEREAMSLTRAIQTIEARGGPGGRTSAVRAHIVRYFRAAATEQGHKIAGHGPRRL